MNVLSLFLAARRAQAEHDAAVAEKLNASYWDEQWQGWRDLSWRLRHPGEFGD